MSVFTAQVHPGRALGFLVLGASLHDILTRLKAEPQRFPKLDLIYEHSSPVQDPIVVNLPVNGIRLRFDGPEQRLRLIEVLDFTKSKLTYNDREVHRPATATPAVTVPTENLSGPTFRHIYNRLLGPTFPGEYIEPEVDDKTGCGLYVLSYPGIAFSFPISSSAWSPGKDVVSLLSSAGQPASSMALFSGESWPDARGNLYTQTLQPLKTFTALPKGREFVPEEVGVVKIHGEGRLELTRPWTSGPFWILLGETTPQELVAELGPPDAIYRKNDQRMSIHKARTMSGGRTRRPSDVRDDSTDTDQSSAHTTTDDSEEESGDGEAAGNVSGECFFNYFYHGFDVLISTPTPPSRAPPSQDASARRGDKAILRTDTSSHVVASKLILHSNVPGSYPFNRHRRCRWEIQYLTANGNQEIINSETPFTDIEVRLHEEWKSIYKNAEEARQRQRGMVLNRDWGDSPGSSCELLGGWEDSVGGKRARGSGVNNDDVKGLGNTTLFGFPGLVFEVLQNDTVSGLTVF